MSNLTDLFRFDMDKDNANYSIKVAFIAALISGSVTLILLLLNLAGIIDLGLTIIDFVDVILVFGLSYGIYRKSRAAAIIMVLYFIGSKIIMSPEFRIGAMSILFILIFIRGAVATFIVRKHSKHDKKKSK